MYNQNVIRQLIEFITDRNGIADKTRLAEEVTERFCLVKDRSVR